MTDPSPQRLFYLYLTVKNRFRFPTRIEREAYDELRAAVAFLQKKGAHEASVEQEATLALRSHVRSLRERYNNGEPFPAVTEDLKPGRREGVHKKPKLAEVEPTPKKRRKRERTQDAPELVSLGDLEELRSIGGSVGYSATVARAAKSDPHVKHRLTAAIAARAGSKPTQKPARERVRDVVEEMGDDP